MALTNMLETVQVHTYMQRLHCHNKECTGLLEADGKSRAENGIHGGPQEFRHTCTVCPAAMWIKGTSYPTLKYELIPETSFDLDKEVE